MIRSAASIRPPPAGLAVLDQIWIIQILRYCRSRLDCLRAFRRAGTEPALGQRSPNLLHTMIIWVLAMLLRLPPTS